MARIYRGLFYQWVKCSLFFSWFTGLEVAQLCPTDVTFPFLVMTLTCPQNRRYTRPSACIARSAFHVSVLASWKQTVVMHSPRPIPTFDLRRSSQPTLGISDHLLPEAATELWHVSSACVPPPISAVRPACFQHACPVAGLCRYR